MSKLALAALLLLPKVILPVPKVRPVVVVPVANEELPTRKPAKTVVPPE